MAKLKIKFVKFPDVFYGSHIKKQKRGPYCKGCGARLTDPQSIKRGYGRNCWSRVPTVVVFEIPPAMETKS